MSATMENECPEFLSVDHEGEYLEDTSDDLFAEEIESAKSRN